MSKIASKGSKHKRNIISLICKSIMSVLVEIKGKHHCKLFVKGDKNYEE